MGTDAAASIGPTRVRCCSRCKAIYRSDFLRCPTDGAPIDEHDGDPLIGTTLGDHYVVEECVGEGAMGRVYRARHARLVKRTFAIKVLLGDLASTLAMRLRFSQEAEAASALDHPNVVRVLDFGRSEHGLLFIVMDYVDGELLTDRIDRGRLPVDEVVALARGMCEGLAHAHDRGLVHRDFKPDNVILADGIPRIVDFGLAIASDPDGDVARLTSVGAAVGTPAYAAPEQAAGGELDHRADLFSLGVTLFEMLAGALPFSGNVAELIYKNATRTPPAISDRAPGAVVPPALEAIVRRLMARRPDDRFASAREVVAALDALTADADATLPVVLVPDPFDDPTPTAPPPGAEAAIDPAPPALAGIAVSTRRRWPWVAVGAAVATAGALVVVAAVRRPASRAPALSIVDDARRAPSPDVPAPMSPPARTEPREVPAPASPAEPSLAVSSPGPAPPRPTAPARPPRRPPSTVETAAVGDVAPRSEAAAGAGRSPVAAAPPPTVVAPAPTVVAPAPTVVAPAPTVAVPRPVVVPATAEIAGLNVRGSLSSGQVRRTIDRAVGGFAACYLPAATRAGRSPAATVAVGFTIEEDGGVRNVKTSGGGLPGLAACVATQLAGARSSVPPDIGTVAVTFSVAFQPELP
ncbi:MAG: protein kinase [Kofleriaceae bacterium]